MNTPLHLGKQDGFTMDPCQFAHQQSIFCMQNRDICLIGYCQGHPL